MKILSKADYVLIIFFILIAIVFNFVLSNILKEEVVNGKVIVYYKNDVYKEFPLEENIEYTVTTDNGINTFKILDNKVKMIDANCKDKICLYEREIEYNNETIICLPNNILIKIESDEESSIDSYVR